MKLREKKDLLNSQLTELNIEIEKLSNEIIQIMEDEKLINDLTI